MSRARNPFSPRMVLAVLAVGAIAFLVMLYALGQGWTGGSDRNGGEHAASNGLTGFAGLAAMLEADGYDVELSRNRANVDSYGLLVLTPPAYTDPEEIQQIIEDRAYYGPTLLVLPKWMAFPVPDGAAIEAEDGWVVLADAQRTMWFDELEWAEDTVLAIGETTRWNGFGSSGDLPDATQVQALVDQAGLPLKPLVVDNEKDVLAGVLNLSGEAYGYDYDDEYGAYPVVVVFEPDLLNNYGMADRYRALAALSLIDTALDGEDIPVVFDLTLPGLGASENLLTLAFRPPFLAATLSLVLAALVIGWRAFRRFGPPIAEAEAMARGKRQLARNGAALVARTRRFHLLTRPYAALMGKRIADALGIRESNPELRDAAIDKALQRRGIEGPGFARAAQELGAASRPRDIIRAASAMKSIERTIKR